MAQGGRRSGIPDCKPFEGLVLTPQVVSTSNPALGPVLHCSGYDNLSVNRIKSNKKILAKYLKWAKASKVWVSAYQEIRMPVISRAGYQKNEPDALMTWCPLPGNLMA